MSQMSKHLRVLTALIMALAILVCAVPASIFAESSETAEALEVVSSYPYTTTTKVKVNLRASRSTRSTLLKKIPAKTQITVKAVKGSWAEVEYKKYSGYVKTDYIVLKEVKKVKVTATPSPAPTLSPEEDAGGYQVMQKGDKGAKVTAKSECGCVFEAETDFLGDFEVRGLPTNKEFTVTIEAPGFQTRVLTCRTNAAFNLGEIYLEKI